MITGSATYGLLCKRASSRFRSGLASATAKNQLSKFRLFVAFSIFVQKDICSSDVWLLLSFLEFLCYNRKSFSTISNTVTALKTQFQLYGLDTVFFADKRVSLFIRSLKIHRPFKVSLKPIISLNMLKDICATCDTMFLGHIFKAVYLTAFFSFLRIFNLVCHSLSSFSHIKQLARADVIFSHPGASLLISWSKTMQTNDKIRLIKIPFLQGSPLCPVTALQVILRSVPGSNNSPLFQIKSKGAWVPLTESRVRKHFSLVLNKLGLQESNFTFHSFRRSGATLAFNQNVSLQNIKAHGTWTSDAVWSYISQDSQVSDEVATSFQKIISTTH